MPSEKWRKRITALLTGLIITLIIIPSRTPSIPDFRVGEIAPKDIRSIYHFSIEDKETTEKRRDESASKVRPIYDFDSSYAEMTADSVRQFFREGRIRLVEEEKVHEEEQRPESQQEERQQEQIEMTPAADEESGEPGEQGREIYKNLTERYKIPISYEQYEIIKSTGFDRLLENRIVELLNLIFNIGVVDNKAMLILEGTEGIKKRNTQTNYRTRVTDLERFLSMEEARKRVEREAQRIFPLDDQKRKIIVEMVTGFLKPNLSPNLVLTKKIRREAREEVSPVFFQVKKGEMIVREGDRINEEDVAILRHLKKMRQSGNVELNFAGYFLVVILILYVFQAIVEKVTGENKFPDKTFNVICVILVLGILTPRIFIFLSEYVADAAEKFPYNSVHSYYFAAPYALGPLIIGFLVNLPVAVISSVVFGLMNSLAVGTDLEIGLFATIGALFGLLGIPRYKQRTVILFSGLLVSLANIGLLTALNLSRDFTSILLGSFEILCGIIGGLLTASIAMVIIPGLESLFQISTDMRLLELSNSEHPLLKKLALVAPGTYHHSIMVGTLAEAAAEKIGANTLLAKVGAYYHDIGKISKPLYFIENCPHAKRRHDNLASHLSRLILISHVKEGVEMAKKHRLSKEIIDIIQQHHGTSLISYFYRKAIETESPKQSSVKKEDFRYPGPKPKTKEAAIVLLADSVEAAFRAQFNSNPNTFRELIRKITNEKFLDRQFDESNLSFKEFTKIHDALFQTLLKYNHQRIPYPEEPAEDKKIQRII